MGAREMNFAIVENKTSPVTALHECDFDGLAAMLCSTTLSPSKDGQGWIPGYIEPGPRTGARVARWHVLVLDIEGKAQRLPDGSKRLTGPTPPTLTEVAAEIELRGWEGVLHTSYSHEEPAADGGTLGPRYRVVLNVSRPILPTEIKPLGLAILHLLGLTDCADTACLEPSRLFYLPRCPEERAHLAQSAIVDGAPVDVDALLSHAQHSAEPPPRKPGPTGASVIDAFNAQADIGLLLENAGYIPKGRNRWIWPGSTSGLAGVVLLPDSGRVFSHHPGDPLHGKHAHDAFSVFQRLSHGGDFSAALKAAARLLGMDRTKSEPVDFSALLHTSAVQEPPDDQEHPLARIVAPGGLKAPEWLLPGFMAAGVTLIAGGHGVGKTTALLPLACGVAGIHEHGWALAPKHWRSVIYVTEDIPQAQRILHGLAGHLATTAEAIAQRVRLVDACRLEPSYLVQVGDAYRARYSRTVQGVELAPLVVLDTQAATLALESENDNSEASAAVAMLKQRFAGLPVWLVAHLAKTSLNRSDVQNLSSRGASAWEADANATAFLVREGDGASASRWLVLGKRRFEPKWAELQLQSHCTETIGLDAWGEPEPLTLRWAIAQPQEGGRQEVADQARKAQAQQEDAELRQDIRDAVQIAWQEGHPLNRAAVKAKMRRKSAEVVACVERLLAEGWLQEIHVPRDVRAHPSRADFLVNLDSVERESVRSGKPLPQAKAAIPESWKKQKAPVPEKIEDATEKIAKSDGS